MMDVAAWLRLFDTFAPTKDLARVKASLGSGHLDAQDAWGMTALHLSVASNWLEGTRVLVEAGANTELRYFRTGDTVLFTALQEKNDAAVKLLLEGGANPDAANYWGKTPRDWASTAGLPHLFAGVPQRAAALPEPMVQNAEHLADHYHPRFKIPSRKERETLVVAQAVDVHVLGPKKPAVKARIRERVGQGELTRYRAALDPQDQETNLSPGTSELSFGPEHVATVYLNRP